MIEFWAVIGLACLDHVFLGELVAHAPDVEGTVEEYGFRLSRYEMGELKRILRIPAAAESMHKICAVSWEDALDDERPCWWSAARSAVHDKALPARNKKPNALVAISQAVEAPAKGEKAGIAAAYEVPNLYIHPLTNRPEAEQKVVGQVSKAHGGSGHSGSHSRKHR